MIDRACISLNSRCNLKCIYCHFAEKKNNPDAKMNEFSPDEAKVFCANLYLYIKSNNLDHFKLGIVGSGEPLLSFAVLKAIVDYFFNSDIRDVIKLYVISNGTLLNEEIVGFFYNHRDIVELDISLDGSPEINLRLRGFYPNFDVYKKYFKEMPRINAVVTKEIIKNKSSILKFFVDNGFNRINFSKVFGTSNPDISITDDEYKAFLSDAKSYGIESRQNIAEKKYDCAKYGRLCGVGRNNIFVTKKGVYPCGRFMNLEKYNLGQWKEPLEEIEIKLAKLSPCPDGMCYYEYNEVDKK